jgi:glutamate synthase domain-containing protein 1
MCGIGGFSLSAESKVHPRQLSNALLTALEDRGYMASGYAFQTPDGVSGHAKAAIPGSGLALKGMPKSANNVIVHTRLATHGSTKDNRNNHPVLSPSGDIALVHNGVIYNHQEVRSTLDRIPFEVDTAVIPALIEKYGGVSELTQLDGDAAISWLSGDDHGTLHLARLSHSPVCVVQIEDGSFIFASTEALMWRVLTQLNLMPVFMENLAEFAYMQIKAGVITQVEQLTRPTHTSYGYNYGYYRHQTSGAKGKWDMDGPYDWDDEDAWDDYNRAVMKDDRYDELDPDDPDEPFAWNDQPAASDAWFIKYRSHCNVHPAYMYYHADEVGDYKGDLWMLTEATTNEYELLDYGAVTISGELVSANSSYTQPDEPDLELF